MFYALQRALALAAVIVLLKIFLPDVANEVERILLSVLRIVGSVLASVENANGQLFADTIDFDY